MRIRYFVGGLLTAALLSTTALAQTNAPAPAPTATNPAPVATDVVPMGKRWRASKLFGVNVYNEQNEKLGGVAEVILDPSGKVIGYVIGVGGFLGMGEHDILVEPSKIRFVNEPVKVSSNTTTTTTTPVGAPTNTRPVSNTTVRTANEQWYPDHGVMSATKDQLKAMQQFKY